MGEALQDLMSWEPKTPAQFVRHELDMAADMARNIVEAVDFGHTGAYLSCRPDLAVHYLIGHVESALAALRANRELLERALASHRRWPETVSWRDLVLRSRITGGEVSDRKRRIWHLRKFRETGECGFRVAHRGLAPSWPEPTPDQIDWTGFDEEFEKAYGRI